MLECPLLLVHPWVQKTLGRGALEWMRLIRGETGQSLGFVRLEGQPNLSWFAMLRKVRLDVFETEDASHLMTLTRRWGVLGSWVVDDAEERHVGNIYPKTIVSSENVHLGYVDREPSGGRILDMHGRAMARFVRKETGVLEVAFTAELPANPFLRMLVLGSILTTEGIPKGY